jgi:hypothetical protein
VATAWGVPAGMAFPGVAGADASADEGDGDAPAEEGVGDGADDVTGAGTGVGVAAGVVVQDESSMPAPRVTANRAGVRVAFKAFS